MKKVSTFALAVALALASGMPLWAETVAYAIEDTCYRMYGPYEVVARDGEYRGSKGGSEKDMHAALEFAQNGRMDEVVRIIDAYAKTLKRIDGHDAPLCTIQGFDLVRAMTIVRTFGNGQNAEKLGVRSEWDRMVREVWLPVIEKFDADMAKIYVNDHVHGLKFTK